jgi:ribonucleotide monophosphatase NagD (HAD superfamily)
VLAESPHRTAYVIGSPAMHRHVVDAGLRILNGSDLATRADVVVVAAHERFDYAELRGAIQAVLRGAELLCAGRDATFPMPDGPWPGAGPVVAAIEAGTGASARSVGKPEPQLFLTALDRLGPGRALVVGDRIDADMRGATELGMDTLHVLSGAHGVRDVLRAPPGDRPGYVGHDLGALLEPHPAPTDRPDGTWVCGAASARVDAGALVLDGTPGLDQFRAACCAVWTHRDAGHQVDITAADALDDLLKQV